MVYPARAALFAVVLALSMPLSSLADMVICTKADGTKYAGFSPPPDCSASKSVGGAGEEVPADAEGSIDVGRERALVACQNGVKEQLKSPGSAQFPAAKSAVDRGGWSFQFEGPVDSQNGFGGLVRSDYKCWVTYAGRDEWKVGAFISGQGRGRMADFGGGGSRQRVAGGAP